MNVDDYARQFYPSARKPYHTELEFRFANILQGQGDLLQHIKMFFLEFFHFSFSFIFKLYFISLHSSFIEFFFFNSLFFEVHRGKANFELKCQVQLVRNPYYNTIHITCKLIVRDLES